MSIINVYYDDGHSICAAMLSNNETIIVNDIDGTSLVADDVQIANDVSVDEVSNIYYTDVNLLLMLETMYVLIFILRILIIQLQKPGLKTEWI